MFFRIARGAKRMQHLERTLPQLGIGSRDSGLDLEVPIAAPVVDRGSRPLLGEAGSIQRNPDVGQLVLNGLKGTDRRAELPALPGVIQHFLQLAQRGSRGPRAQAQSIESDNRVVDRCECAGRGGEFELREQRFPQEQLIPLAHTGVIQIHPGKGRLPLCCANDNGNVCGGNRIDEIDCAANRAVKRICGIEVRDEPRGFDTERRDDFARVNLRQPGGLASLAGPR